MSWTSNYHEWTYRDDNKSKIHCCYLHAIKKEVVNVTYSLANFHWDDGCCCDGGSIWRIIIQNVTDACSFMDNLHITLFTKILQRKTKERSWEKCSIQCRKLAQIKQEAMPVFNLPYARHYKPRLVYFFTPFPNTIYVLWPLVLCMACIQERLLIKSGLWWHAYGTQSPFLQEIHLKFLYQ